MKVNVLVGAKVIADVSRGLRYMWNRTPEREAQTMESLCSEFNEFVRDHRSMDWVTLDVEREYEDQCSHCHWAWEVDSDGVPTCCDKAIEEHELSLKDKSDV